MSLVKFIRSIGIRKLVLGVFGVVLLGSGGIMMYSCRSENNDIRDNIIKGIEESTVDTSSTVQDIVTDTSQNMQVLDELVDASKIIKSKKTYKDLLYIPKIDLIAHISEGVDEKALEKGVGRHTDTAKIGEYGNCALAGHSSDTYDCIFNGLDKVKKGDTFCIYDSNSNRHKYDVVDTFVCNPEDIRIIYAEDIGVKRVTLYTCTNSGKNRYVVVGHEILE